MINKELRIIFFGTPDFIIPVIKSLDDQFDLIAIVTAPDKAVGRQKILTPAPVKLAFPDKKVLTPKELDQKLVENLQKLKPDLFVVGAYGKIIPQSVLEIPKYGSINIHPSALPKYRGATPLQNTILNGDKSSAISIILMDEEIDHGPIISTMEFSLSEQDTLESLSNKVWLLVAEKLPAIIEDFVSGKIFVTPQNHGQATYTKILIREDGYFDIDNQPPAEILDRMIRAYYPWPTVWTKWGGKVVKFLPKEKVQMEGKKPVNLKDFLNGYPNFPIREI